MSNKYYLCCCDADFIYPPLVKKKYKAGDCVILCCDVSFPLLWLGFFRIEDYKKVDCITIDKERFKEEAPIINKSTGLTRLRDSVMLFDELFGKLGTLSEHAKILGDYVESKPGNYLSLMTHEITTCDSDGEKFRQMIKLGLEFLGGKRVDNIKDVLIELTTVIPDRKFCHPIGLTKRNDIEKEDAFNMFRIMGYGWYKSVPWDVW